VSELTAMFAASEFSNIPYDKTRVEAIEQRLRYLVSQQPTYEPVNAYYF
jgi:hypothetical protein